MKQKKRKGKIVTGGRIFFTVIIVLVLVYAGMYAYAREHAKKADIRYYTSEDKVEYMGVEYTVSAKLYTEEELIREFGLEEVQWKMINSDVPYEYKYIVVEKDMKRIKEAEETKSRENEEALFQISSKYWTVGRSPDVESLIQKEAYISAEELEVGEETSGYQVFCMADINHHKKIWNNMENDVVYYDMRDYEGSEYMRRIKVLN